MGPRRQHDHSMGVRRAAAQWRSVRGCSSCWSLLPLAFMITTLPGSDRTPATTWRSTAS